MTSPNDLVLSYLSCLLRFPGEDNDTAIERFYAHYDYSLDFGPHASLAQLIEEQAHSGIALTPRMVEEIAAVKVNITGLDPSAILLYKEKLDQERRRQQAKTIGQRLLAVSTGQSNEDIGAIVNDVDLETEHNQVAMDLPTHSAVGMKMYLDRADELASGKLRVSFPWRQVNKAVPFIYDDDVILLTGMSKHGKSSAAHQIALYNASKMHVLYFHNEDNALKMFLRRIAQYQLARDPDPLGVGGVHNLNTLDYRKLLDTSVKTPELLAHIEAESNFVMQKIGDRLTYVYCAGWTADQIVAEWRKQRRQHPLGLVVIDYLNKIESYAKAKVLGTMAGAMEYNVELFKREAGRRNAMTPCLLIQQENEDGTVRDTRSSYIKSQLHLSVVRDVDESGIQVTGNIKVLRANDGVTGNWRAVFYPPYMVWLA
jgi:hypothetical protein